MKLGTKVWAYGYMTSYGAGVYAEPANVPLVICGSTGRFAGASGSGWLRIAATKHGWGLPSKPVSITLDVTRS